MAINDSQQKCVNLRRDMSETLNVKPSEIPTEISDSTPHPSPLRVWRGGGAYFMGCLPGVGCSPPSLQPRANFFCPFGASQFGFALMDSFAPAQSALAGLRLRRIPFAVSQTAQVVKFVSNPAVLAELLLVFQNISRQTFQRRHRSAMSLPRGVVKRVTRSTTPTGAVAVAYRRSEPDGRVCGASRGR